MAKKRARKSESQDSPGHHRDQAAQPQVIIARAGTKQVVSVNMGEAPVVYANNAAVEASNWDVRIRLGQIQSIIETEIKVKDVVTVYMSHEHAKAFVDALGGIVVRLDELKRQVQHAESSKPH